jgi:hypothetical protein
MHNLIKVVAVATTVVCTAAAAHAQALINQQASTEATPSYGYNWEGYQNSYAAVGPVPYVGAAPYVGYRSYVAHRAYRYHHRYRHY